jgi:hypothetical protein
MAAGRIALNVDIGGLDSLPHGFDQRLLRTPGDLRLGRSYMKGQSKNAPELVLGKDVIPELRTKAGIALDIDSDSA